MGIFTNTGHVQDKKDTITSKDVLLRRKAKGSRVPELLRYRNFHLADYSAATAAIALAAAFLRIMLSHIRHSTLRLQPPRQVG